MSMSCHKTFFDISVLERVPSTFTLICKIEISYDEYTIDEKMVELFDCE